MKTQAIYKTARISPFKARLVADQIRGLGVEQASNILTFSQLKAAQLVKKTLDSAIANAENNHGADVDGLKVSAVFVNEGAQLKRIRTRARGRADRIIKRTCHICVQVSDNAR